MQASDTVSGSAVPERRASWMRAWHRLGYAAAGLLVLFLLPVAVPDDPLVPVAGAGSSDWNPRSFWAHPWGRSGVHKGIDIFAPEGSPVLAATSGLVLFSGRNGDGGNAVAVLGPRWRIHYYAHLKQRDAVAGSWVGRGELLGTVGTTGNAAGKPPHLHYAVITLVPYPWRFVLAPQGWRRMFYLDPGRLLAV